jgi:thiol:disulfide interchange protein/DsbC/DsbD-like thiol-disulfide interchange protein
MTCIYKNLFTPAQQWSRVGCKCISILFFAAGYAFSPWTTAQFNPSGSLPGSTKSVDAVVQTAQVRAELVAHAPNGVGLGKQVWLGLKLQHQPEWHTYWKNAGDSGLPTQLQWTLPAGAQAGSIEWPTPQKIAVGRLANFGYEGTVLLPVPLSITPDFKPPLLGSELEVKLFASWLVCRKECIPQEGQFVLRIPIKSSTAIHGGNFDVARATSPVPLSGPARVQINANALTLTVSGLPNAWWGKAVNAFPETAEVIETAAAPSSADAITTGSAQRAGTQAWADGVWSASLPLSIHRSASPKEMPVVLAQGKQSFVVQAVVGGTWPPVAPQATVPAALQLALDANAAANVSPNPTGHAALFNGAVEGGDLGSLWWTLAAALLGGLILNLMPCVFPVLAIKVLGFANGGTHGHTTHRTQGLAYTAGVMLSFMALGALMLGLRAGGEQLGWGFQLQSPTVIAVLALLFTLLGLNMAGLFEVVSLVPSRWANVQLRHPALDAFLSGVLAVAVASPCTAPFMGASLGYAITLPSAQALGIFAALGLGLALPYLVVSWVPGAGAWLPQPGVWMVHLRNFMAFLMWAMVVWLVWVLGHLSGIDGAASLLALLLSVALVVWSLGLEQRSRLVFATISFAACAALVWAIGKNVLQIESTPTTIFSPTTAQGTSTGGSPSWQAWAPGRVEAELATGKPVFVDFTAAWCITCQYNKKTTLGDPEVLADFHTKQVTLLRADWTRRDPAITLALGQLGRNGVPVYVLYKTGRAPVVLSEILSVGDVRNALAAL